MIDDVEDGGPEDLDEIEFPTPEQKALRKKVTVIVVSLVVVFAGIGVWYFQFRPWSIEEVATKVSGSPYTPGFDPSLAGKTVYVSGKVTGFDVNYTTLGPLTIIELDDFSMMHLVEWKEPTFKLGDVISMKVHFEWSRYNDDIRVFSRQLDFPWFNPAFSVPVVMAAVSYYEGMSLWPKNDPSSDDAILEIILPRREGFPLELFNVTLKKGVTSWADEYIDVISGYKGNPQLDYMKSLEDGVGENGTIEFTDANENGLLDDHDYFRLNLTRPVEDSAFLTYLLDINDAHTGGYGVLKGGHFIVMTNKGVFWAFGDSYGDPDYPNGLLMLRSEVDTDGTVSAEIVISEVSGADVELREAGCSLSHEEQVVDWDDLEEGNIDAKSNHSATFHDADQNGLVSEGDFFVLSGLLNLTDYRFSVRMSRGGFMSFHWTTGLGVFSGDLPVIEWNEPLALDYPTNHTFRLQIGRMYGIPGVLLGQQWDRIVVDILVDGQSVLSYANLTSDFNYTSPNTSITFEDSDSNGYVNSGDFFICNTTVSAEFELKVGYVDYVGYPRHEQILISWPISWRTG